MASLATALAGENAAQEEGAERVEAVDGDTLQINGELVQLWGIDAPELGQTCLNAGKRWRCGREAAFALKRLLAFGPVACKTMSADGARKTVTCASGTKDLATALLQQGYAVTLPDASPAYKNVEASARTATVGLWRGEFVQPWNWRQGKRLPGAPQEQIEVCDIKGTITAKGNRVYYVPTDEKYDSVEVDPARGGRMFCSDDEAEVAGWRRYPRN